MTYYTKGLMRRTARFQHFQVCFATVRERERRDCLVAKTIYFNITKLLRPGNIANGAQKPLRIDQICHFEPQLILSLRIRLSERRDDERGKEKDR